MKRVALFLCIFLSTICFSQKSPAGQSKQVQPKTAMDSFSYELLSATIKMIKVAEDSKKSAAFLMSDLRETSKTGEPVYAAPYSINGFPSTVRKIATDRTNNTTTWEWQGVFAQTSDADKIEYLDKKADSLLQRLKYKEGKTAHSINTLFSFANKYTKSTPVVMVMLRFQKSIHNTERQAQDSLLALYKPLLLKPALAADVTEKLCGSFLIEGFSESKTKSIIQPLVAEIAATNTEAAFQVLMGVPDFTDPKGTLAQLPERQRDEIKAMAQKHVDAFYEAERKKVQGDPVVTQQKQLQTQRQMGGCHDIPDIVKYKYRVGITMEGSVDYNPFIGMLTAVDCENKKVTIVKPGSRRKELDKKIVLSFSQYSSWVKYHEQYYRCTRCAGEGGEMVTTTESKTKELPFGYFEGIETKVKRTTTKTAWENCVNCGGTGWVLEPDKKPGFN